jgi:pyroglutamyl-peptidase
VLTGFGPFVSAAENPSGAVVERLAASPPRGVELVAAVLPVSLARVGAAYDELLARLDRSRPAALLALGVHGDPYWRLERAARARLGSAKPDNDGAVAAGATFPGAAELQTELDLDAAAAVLRSAGADPVRVSGDAGGFVCERAYHHALGRARELGIPCLFLHVPPAAAVSAAAQLPAVAALAEWIAARARTPHAAPALE